MEVVIMGGGIAGLGLARLLREQGHGVRVFERHAGRRRQGHGLLLLANGLRALQDLGLGEGLAARSVPIDGWVTRLRKGAVVAETPIQDACCIARSDLMDLLAEGAGPVQAGMCFEGLQHQGQRVVSARLRPTGGGDVQTISADLYVGADGLRSRVRGALFHGHALAPAGVRELVSVAHAPGVAADLGTRFHKVWHERGRLAVGMGALPGGKVVWFIQHATSDWTAWGQPKQDERRVFAEQVTRDFPSDVQALVAATDFAHSHVWAIHDMPVLTRLHRNNAVLVGDAAHPGLTLGSQGANSALVDACRLAAHLPGPGSRLHDLPQALSAFTHERRPVLARHHKEGRALLAGFLAGTLPTAPTLVA